MKKEEYIIDMCNCLLENLDLWEWQEVRDATRQLKQEVKKQRLMKYG